MNVANRQITVGFAGNPNCGKTTLFNTFTGARLKVANWPGVTVERVEGGFSYQGCSVRVIDLPGIYSLTSYTIEERVTRKCMEGNEVDVIVNVVDASSLERNLYLTLQLLELNKPVILALNMIDIVKERQIEIDFYRLSKMLGHIPVVPVSAKQGTGLDALMEAIIHYDEKKSHDIAVRYSDNIEQRIARTEAVLKAYSGQKDNVRWQAIKMMEHGLGAGGRYPEALHRIIDKDYEKDIINEKYDYIGKIIGKCLFGKEKKTVFTDKLDRIMIHPLWGIPVFLGIMALVFFLTFMVGDLLKQYFENGLDWFSDMSLMFLQNLRVSVWVTSLVVDGIIAGVGGILTFLPNIAILFLALAFLEDSGYMPRVAYIMNETMGMVGLSGKAFLPMLLGFGCTVPAIMATRTLESVKDRRRTILITPFMSCSARLPIYVLFSGMFFPRHAVLTAYSLYVTGLAAAIIAAYIVHRCSDMGYENTLLIELPEYKTPNLRTVLIYVWDKVRDYLTKAGTTIFIASIILWFILNTGPSGYTCSVSQSFAALIGRRIAPALAPAGLGSWQIAVALISGISAKEVVVSSFSVLYGIGNINSAAGMTQLSAILRETGFGGVNAYALMIFCLLYTPCLAAIATIRKETQSVRWTLLMITFQLAAAWTAAVCVFQAGSRIF